MKGKVGTPMYELCGGPLAFTSHTRIPLLRVWPYHFCTTVCISMQYHMGNRISCCVSRPKSRVQKVTVQSVIDLTEDFPFLIPPLTPTYYLAFTSCKIRVFLKYSPRFRSHPHHHLRRLSRCRGRGVDILAYPFDIG